jgi:hypothetical protein
MSKNVISASLVAGLLALWLGSGLFIETPEGVDVVLAEAPARSPEGFSDEPLSRVRVGDSECRAPQPQYCAAGQN